MSCEPGATNVDFIHALAYARQQTMYNMCNDSSIVSQICDNNPTGEMSAGGGTCITWKQDEKKAFFSNPSNYYEKSCMVDSDCYLGKCVNGSCVCTSDSDCGNLNCLQSPTTNNMVCGYAPGTVAAGNCVFNNETACLAQSLLPYDCSVCGPQGNIPAKCNTVNPDSPQAQFPYLEWHTDDKGQGKCVLGNFALRQWCEYPCSRCAPNKDGTYPSMCTAGLDSPGVSDVPPFFYDRNKGMCYMTHDYCDRYGLEYNMGSCSTDADCGPGNYCDQRTGQPRCTGPSARCYDPTGQKIAEFLIGKTLFYMFKKGTTCGAFKKEGYEKDKRSYNKVERRSENVVDERSDSVVGGRSENKEIKDINFSELNQSITDSLKNISDNSCFYYDSKEIKNKKLIAKNYAGKNVNLYMFLKENSMTVGFDPLEVRKVYPKFVKKQYDDTYIICVNKEDVKEASNKDKKNVKRLYLTLGSKSWISNLLGNFGGLLKKK